MLTQEEATIRPAAPDPAEIAACLDTLTRAFEADPVCSWAWPDRAHYRNTFPVFCQAFGGAAFKTGTAHVDPECMGVALWLAPGTAPDEDALAAVIRDSTPAHLQEPLFSLFEQMGSYHPHEPHWHLPLIGVHPSLQGKGVGSALLRHALTTCDKQKRLAYLEATSPANARLYERHGFQPVGRVQVADSPPVVPMLRNPRPRERD